MNFSKLKSLKALAPFVLTFLASTAWSQVTITSPANNSRWAAGPDYATDVRGDPWDMSNPDDISRDPDDRGGFTTFGFPGDGTVGGQAGGAVGGASVDPTISFLERGYHDIIHTAPDGKRFPIDSSVYRKITFKMFTSAANQLPRVTWFQSTKGDPAANEAQCTTVGAETARCGVMFANVVSDANTYKIYTADTTQVASVYGTQFSTLPVLGLRVNPAASPGGGGANVFFDWVRITRSDTDPSRANMPITWSGGTVAAIQVIDAAGAVFDVKAANCPSGTSPCNFNYGVLPPGQYTLQVGNARAIFVINSPALGQVTDPSESQPSGSDFATTVLNNPWDMNDAADVFGTSNVANPTFSGGVFSGTNTNGDPLVVLFNSNSGVTIDTSKYRYLTYRMKLDGSFDIGNGSVARVFWSSTVTPLASQVTTSKDIVTYPGTIPGQPDFVDYTIDLSSLFVGTNGGIEPGGQPQTWTAAGPVRYLRLDPHEFDTPRKFYYDFVRLAAMPEVQPGSTFVIKYSSTDSDSAGSTVALYYAANKSGAKTLIANNLPIAAAGQYQWLVKNVPAGDYWIFIETTDTSPANNGPDTRGLWSTGQLRVLVAGAPGAPTIGTASAASSTTATVTFTPPPSDGGATITSYTATCTSGGGAPVTGTSAGSPITVAGLTTGTQYTCTVHATNSAGNGPESGPSNAVTTSTSNTLAVTLKGSGTGTVVGTGISCPGDCTETHLAPTQVILTAGTSNNSVFTGWLGSGCTGAAATCTVSVAGQNSVSATFAATGTIVSLDIDNSSPSSKYNALTDGLLVLRYLFGITGSALTAQAVDAQAKRSSAAQIVSYLVDIEPALDIDGNSTIDALTDGLMILRKLFGLDPASVTANAIGAGATRNSSQINAYILTLTP